ncbi:metal-sensing transcriptional repressor [Cytobacillus oceanisediminis]|uniref:metal-sensing transcriptional repressor n=1 Tax=Cytobacillus oceanisediminis TaxID=665099 RepID=UPI00203BD448|nr:metal-sensing transcriptional repressor [Cytobacillus oceanisediminis]
MNRIEGQIKGIKNMKIKQTYFDNILHQITAAQAALDSVSRVLLRPFLKLLNKIFCLFYTQRRYSIYIDD